MVVYMAVLTAFWVLEAEKKRKKRCGGEVGRRGDGGELEPGRGMTGEVVRMTAASCWWWWLVQRQSKYVITPLSGR